MSNRKHTYTVTAFSFPSVGVVRCTEVASGLTRREVLAKYPDCVFRHPNKGSKDDLVPSFAADPEWVF
jgi:hypothetical protein